MTLKKLLLTLLLVSVPTVQAAEIRSTAPRNVGMSAERLERINELMQESVANQTIAGSVTLVARKGKVVHFEATGLLDLDTGQAMQKDSLFRIYSMTKPITSIAAMLLFEQGKFQLDDPIAKYLPEFKDVKVLLNDSLVEADHAPTIRELMTHTAGLSYGIFSNTEIDRRYRKTLFGDTAMVDITHLSGDAAQNHVTNLAEMSQSLAKIPLLYQPGSRWVYSLSVDILGRLIEVISERPLDQFLQEQIFDPLKMEDTFFEIPETKISRFGTNHSADKTGNLIVIDRPSASPFSRSVSLFSGGGGLISSTMDYLRFAQMLLNGGELDGIRILSPTTVALMQRNQLTETSSKGYADIASTNESIGFGLGFGLITGEQKLSATEVGAYSWGGLAGTLFWVDPTHELIAILMIQRVWSPEVLRSRFRNLTYQAIIEME